MAHDAPFTFLHLTDTHLMPPGRRLYGLDPAERLRAAVADIRRRHGPDGPAPAAFALLTGDLVHDPGAASYALLREILAPLPMPVHLLLGNHDDRALFRAAFPEAPVDPAGSGNVPIAGSFVIRFPSRKWTRSVMRQTTIGLSETPTSNNGSRRYVAGDPIECAWGARPGFSDREVESDP